MSDRYKIYIKNGGPGRIEILVDHFDDGDLTEANSISGKEADRVFNAFMSEYEKLRKGE